MPPPSVSSSVSCRLLTTHYFPLLSWYLVIMSNVRQVQFHAEQERVSQTLHHISPSSSTYRPSLRKIT
jgi:hypothetical protein